MEEIADYIFAQRSPRNTFAFAIRLVEDLYLHLGDLSEAWKMRMKYNPSSASDVHHLYRTKLPQLYVPAQAIIDTSKMRESRLSEKERALFTEFSEEVLREQVEAEGMDVIEESNRVQDIVYDQIRSSIGRDLELSLFERASHGEVQRLRQIRQVLPSMITALESSLHKAAEEWKSAFPNKEAATAAIATTIRERTIAWKKGQYYDVLETSFRFPAPPRSQKADGARAIAAFAPQRLHFIRLGLSNRVRALALSAENRFRAHLGVPGVGQGWIAESRLIARLREAFPQYRLETQASPSWLKPLRFDGYFPEFRVAVEYQGEQHFSPVTRFGGAIGFAATKARDKLKVKMAAENGCAIIFVRPDYDPSQVVAEVARAIATVPSSKQPLIQGRAKSMPAVRPEISANTRVTSKRATSKDHRNKVRLAALGSHDLLGCARYGTSDLIHEIAAQDLRFKPHALKRGSELLAIAASAGNLEVLRAFLELGVDPNTPTRQGGNVLSVLCDASTPPNLEAVKILLDAGVAIDKYTRGLDIFIRKGRAAPMIGAALLADLPLAKLLFQYGASPAIAHKETGYTPISAICADWRWPKPPMENRVQMLLWLAANGGDPHALARGRSALEILCLRFHAHENDFLLARNLMELGVRLDPKYCSAIRREYEIAPTRELERIISYSEGHKI